MLVDSRAIETQITETAWQYHETAPFVAEWMNTLIAKLEDGTLTVYEICQLSEFYVDGTWEDPNSATNRTYKTLERMGENIALAPAF